MNEKINAAASFALVLAVNTLGQGTFQNLDFEAARVVFIGSTQMIEATNALPGWTAFDGANQMTSIYYNRSAAAAPVNLLGSNVAGINGSFSVILQGGSISQVGTVPTDAKSLLFKGRVVGGSPLFVVTLGGQNLFYMALLSATNYTVFGADVSGFAGQAAMLSCSVQGYSQFVIDDFEFSPRLIPEPGALGLVGIGSFCFAARWIRRRSKRGG